MTQETAEKQDRIDQLEAELQRLRRERDDWAWQARHYRALVEDAGAIIYTLDPDGRVSYMAPQVDQVLDHAAAEMTGRHFSEFVHPQDLDRVLVSYQRTVAGHLEPIEYRFRDGSQAWRWIRSLSRPVYEDGVFQGMRGLLIDVDEQIRYREALEFQKRRLDSLLQHSTLAILALDHDNHIEYVNPHFTELFGYQAWEVEGKNVDEVLVSPEYDPHARMLTQRTIRGQTVHSSGFRRHKDGRLVEVDIHGVPLIVDDELIGIWAVYSDLSRLRQAQDELAAKEALYRALFETASDAIFTIQDDRIVECNAATFDIFGGTREDVVGRRPFDLSPEHQPDGRRSEEAGQVYLNLAESGFPQCFEWRHQRMDGETFEAEVWLTGLEVLGQRYVLAFVRDVTDQKRLMAAWKETAEKYQTILEVSRDGYFEIDDQGHFEFASKAFARIAGRRRAEIIGAHFRDLTTLHEAQRAQDDFQRLLRTRRPESGLEWTIENPELGPRLLEVSVSLMGDDDGRPSGFRGIARDLTERKNAAEALRKSEERYRELFDSISDLIMTHDLDGRLISFNPAVCKAVGLAPEQLAGRRISEFIPIKYRHYFEEQYLEKLMRDHRAEGVFILEDASGTIHHIEYRTALIELEDAATSYVTGMGRDVTERIRAQRELRTIEEQLAQSQKMRAIGTLASGIAHDFNNILQAISGYLQLMLSRPRPLPDDRRYLEEIDKTVYRASDLIKGLLTFSRSVDTRRETVDLNHQLEQTVNLLQRTLPKMIEIQTDLTEDLCQIEGDPSQLEQILFNIGSNAKDAMPDGGLLIIETRNIVLREADVKGQQNLEPGRYVLLRVSDTGAGMDDHTLGHIFDPFFTTKEVGQGTGLGLSTVYGIVQAHGGMITCSSAPDQGAAFEIYLPAVSREAAAGTKAEPHLSQPLGGTESILIVDDESAILEVAEEMLSASGYRVQTATTGEEALDCVAQSEAGVDLVLLDLGMPGMGGETCLRKLKEMDPEIKVIIASGYLTDQGLESVMDSGAQGFLPKPYRLGDLLTKIRGVLDADSGD